MSGTPNGIVIDDARLFNERLREGEGFYDYNRPHATLGGQSPYEQLRERMKLCVQTVWFSLITD